MNSERNDILIYTYSYNTAVYTHLYFVIMRVSSDNCIWYQCIDIMHFILFFNRFDPVYYMMWRHTINIFNRSRWHCPFHVYGWRHNFITYISDLLFKLSMFYIHPNSILSIMRYCIFFQKRIICSVIGIISVCMG